MAHKPTFNPAKGGSNKGEQDLSKLSKQYSSRDLPSHTKLKYRQPGQDSAEEVKNKDLKKTLEEKEKSRDKRGLKDSQSSSSSRKRQEDISAGNLDADDPLDLDEDEDVESDEDDTAALMAELNKIKKEREAEKVQQEVVKKAEEERIRTECILMGNPLLNASSKQDFKVKRRWDDDVVFKNCAKGVEEKKKRDAATFINDALRSEFHKKFMDKYIK